MNKVKKKKLKAKGFKIGNAKKFLNLNDDEAKLVELRIKNEKGKKE